MTIRRPAQQRALDFLCIALTTAFIAVVFLRLHAVIAPSAAPDMAFLRHPGATPTAAMGWWAWWDQGLYERAAVSWANGVTDPAFHWYLPLYPLLASVFVRVTPTDPFLVVDLACLIGTFWLFCAMAKRLLGDIPLQVPVACALFIGSALIVRHTLWSWVVPWTTTPETLCVFAALLSTMRLIETGQRRDAFVAGLATVSIAGFRPIDAVVATVAICLTVAPILMSQPKRLPGVVAAAVAGATIPALVIGGAYLATWGIHLSSYIILSERIGFEPRLLALRWVTLMLDPRPLIPGGMGLARNYVWIVPGCMGIAATLVTMRGARAALHRLVILMLVCDTIMFLIFRDLHPTGLWLHANYHYFKWMLPIFAVYAFRLIPIALGREGRRSAAIAAAGLIVPLLFCWRLDVAPIEPLPSDGSNHTVTLPSGLSPINALVTIPTIPTIARAPDVVSGQAETSTGTALRDGLDFVIYGGSDALQFVPLRPLPIETTVLSLADETIVDWTRAPELARQSIIWGWPRWFTGKTGKRLDIN